jgi:integrase/recombinase XerD
MIVDLVEAYLAMRRACGFELKSDGSCLLSFAAFSDARGQDYVCRETAVEWAGLARTVHQRARRIGHVIRFTRFARVEDPRHEMPTAIFGSEKGPRPVPYILSGEDIQRLVQAAFQLGCHSLRRQTYGAFFSLLACTGLRTSEAIHLRYGDITPDGLVIRDTKFKKSRLVPIHETARAGLERYLEQRRPYAPLDDHVFVSLRRKPLTVKDVETAFYAAVKAIGLPYPPVRPRPTPHSLRHSFAVRSLEGCPDGRDHITKHMLGLSTYLGHGNVAHTYWYLEATPDLMRNIAERCEAFVTGAQS